ncbi:MAG: enoyl-ACP reductase FabI [Chloroflexota bacterium]
MGLLDGQKAVVFGVANRRSIAWGIARALSREGSQIALMYESQRLEKMVRECADHIPGTLTMEVDVTDDEQIQAAYQRLKDEWGGLDTVVHSLAFAPSDELKGNFLDTSRAGFQTALDISAYSLIPVTRHAVPLMKQGGSVITMTYIGSQRVFPNYNVMGVAKAALEATVRYLAADLGPSNVRVNAISAGPISTLAARGVRGFSGFAKAYADQAPLKRQTTSEEVGDTAVYLASNLSRAVTGDIIYVDEGFHAVGS